MTKSTITAHHDDRGNATDISAERLHKLGQRILDQAYLETLPREAREHRRIFPRRTFNAKARALSDRKTKGGDHE